MCPYCFQPMVIQPIAAAKRGGFMQREISFVLNGSIHHASDCAGDMTLLDWLREQPHLRGTKQGCGEGDCGACTVSIARTDANGNLVYRPVNACILFMGMVNGAAIRTVEGLAICGDQLHPVQAAMVENDASQCGFCTPGFVMTLYTAYQNGSGLGLSISQTLINHHGGKIDVESHPGHTEFVIYIPIERKEIGNDE